MQNKKKKTYPYWIVRAGEDGEGWYRNESGGYCERKSANSYYSSFEASKARELPTDTVVKITKKVKKKDMLSLHARALDKACGLEVGNLICWMGRNGLTSKGLFAALSELLPDD